MNSKEEDKSYISQNEILYTVKKEFESKGETDQRKKIVELGPRKFEGIGPMTKEGIPIVLRSEVKDANQAKWYKRMYDSLHRTGKDDEYVTIRYKPRRGHYPYTSPGGYLSEPEPGLYDSDIGYSAKYATLDRRRIRNKENDFTTSTLPRSRYVPHPASIKYATEVYKNQPGRIEDYEPGHSSISDKETKQWWDEVLDIFDGATAEPQTIPSTPLNKPFMAYALKDGYESDSTLVFKRRDENLQNQLSPAEQKLAYKTIQKGGEVPLHGLRKLAPERPKESPHRYVESEVTIHYRSPVRSEAKEVLSEEELARRQAEAMRRIYQEERRRKYLHELQDMNSRRHTDNFTPSQKSPIPLNRYDDFLDDVGYKGKPRDRTPEPKLVARALYNFVGQTSRELSFRRGDIIFVRRQIDKNWYEGEHNAMVGLFPFNYVEIIPYDGIRTIPKLPNEGQARAKFNFIAQTHLELSLVKGELVVLTRRVDDNWFEGRIGNRKGIFPVSYVEVLSEPGEKPGTPVAPLSKPITLPASHTVLMNGSGIKQSMGHHSYQPSSYYSQNKMASSYTSSNPYATLPRQSQTLKQPLAPVNQTLHIDTHSEPVPYRALYNYRPQNEDELELCEGDTVYVMEKCDDGWYVGSSQRTGYFGTFPGNYVERI
ncbi:sorbin and SH3 domain-containing protein 1 isoform X5 [Zootermopsis nevadensis]|uniref:sorbin and SH3 domain-containing protein 1 isoform X5 n=1 Tax=Zootermopsis nevadensis TaxID=136037 RepID=UPI000B8E9669|nr:sorbin and SH3 domain-containing protein 1 isoform X5 [Zootermopsis nevadensis]